MTAMWLLYALFASILWGIDYSLTENMLRHVSVSTLLCFELLVAFLAMLGLALKSGSLQRDLSVIRASSPTAFFIIVLTLVFTTANFLIATSIGSKNATLAA